MWRCSVRDQILYPYFTWLMAAATFFPPVSNDYNLFYLPLAALAVWDRRDAVVVHLLLALLLLWWQPLLLPIGAGLLMFFKLAGVAGVGLSLLARVRELSTDQARSAVVHGARFARWERSEPLAQRILQLTE